MKAAKNIPGSAEFPEAPPEFASIVATHCFRRCGVTINLVKAAISAKWHSGSNRRENTPFCQIWTLPIAPGIRHLAASSYFVQVETKSVVFTSGLAFPKANRPLSIEHHCLVNTVGGCPVPRSLEVARD